MPGWENIFVFTDDVYQVVVTLRMNLDVRQELEFVRLQGTDDLGFESCGGTSLGDDVGAEDLYLLLGEVCVSKNVLNLYETFAQLLITVPDVVADGEAAAEVQEREHRDGEVLALGRFAPVVTTGEAKDEGFNGGIALRLYHFLGKRRKKRRITLRFYFICYAVRYR